MDKESFINRSSYKLFAMKLLQDRLTFWHCCKNQAKIELRS